MRMRLLTCVIVYCTATWPAKIFAQIASDSARFVTYFADPAKQEIKLYWKNDKNELFNSIANLKAWVEMRQRKLLFAMNGGMYMEDHTPVGLYIENGKKIRKINTAKASGNFYLQPNGVFCLSKNNIPVVCKTGDFKWNKNIIYATQSGPMLVINGQIHPAFKQGSTNLNIRNGVGILPGNKIVFAMSREPVNLYDFAMYFKKLGCTNALYLDGFVSRAYAPQQNWVQLDGDFGVMIGVCNKQ